MTGTARVRIWPVLLAAAAGFALLCSLGIWQVQRLHWKERLIDQLGARAAAAPVGLAEAEAALNRGEDIEFLKLRFSATYLFDTEKTMISTIDGGPGFTVITPAVTADGRAVLVDRGQVPPERLKDYGRPQGEVEVTGVVRQYRNGQARFDPDNDPAANQWYWWDIPAMLKASKLAPGIKALPVVVQLLPGSAAADDPRPPEPRANLTNNHLGYAITWFGLALALLAVTGAYLRSQMKKSDA